MTRGILIAGNESPLFVATADEAVTRVKSFASILIPNRFSTNGKGTTPPPKVKLSEGAIPLSWNPASSISARTAVLAAENRLGQINDAILVCSPPAVFRTAEDFTPEEIEFFVNDNIKGWFFLIRELILYFRRAGKGSLSLVVPEISFDDKTAQSDLLGPPALASFRAYTQSILAISTNEPFLFMGFTGCEAGAEKEFSEWLFKIIDEGAKKNRGRLLKYSKLKFFR